MHLNRKFLLSATILALILLCGRSLLQAVEEEKPKPKPKATTPKAGNAESSTSKSGTYKVRRGPLSVIIKLDGVFEAGEMAKILLYPKEWSDLTVLEAAAQGTRVKAGDVLIKLDRTKIDKAISDLLEAQELSNLSLKQAIEDLELLEKITPIELAAAQRAAKIAKEDLDYFHKVELPLSKKSVRYSLKSSEFYLQNELEELRQLEKMYKADELTEETEEIVLKRQRFYVERAKFSFEQSKISHDRMLNTLLPRSIIAIDENAKTTALELKQVKSLLPIKLRKQRLELDKLKLQFTKDAEKLAKLQADRKAMMIKAPIGGLVYYGQCVRGKWSGQAQAEKQLKPNGKLAPGAVVMTIVKPGDLHLRVMVPEKHIGQLRPGMTAKVVPTGFSQSRLDAKIISVSTIAVSAEGFDAEISVDIPKAGPSLVAGMSGKFIAKVYSREDAIIVPGSAVFGQDDGEPFVYVVVKKKNQRRNVTLGQKTSEKTEILKGLKPGETILLKKPSE